MTDELGLGQWLTYAEADLRAAEHLVGSGDFMASAFHCQQAVEKMLKAVIVAETEQRPPYLHNLRLLLEYIDSIEVPEDVVGKIIRIEPHYIGSRYPGVVDPDSYERESTEQLLDDTREVYQWFLKELEKLNNSNNSSNTSGST